MSNILNVDSQPIKNWEETTDGYMKLWLSVGVANYDLNYDGRIEVIDKPELIDENSMSTAVGRPIVLNHPPRAVSADLFNRYAKGVSLQEYAQDGNSVYFSTLVWDKALREGIKNGEYTHTSSAYYAKKTPQKDGKIKQSNRIYDHFAILSKEYTPRAGISSKILLLNQDSNDSDETNKKDEEKMNVDADEIKNRTELLVNWLPVLKEHNKTIDYNLDSNNLKKLILSCYYPENVINQLNQDAVLSGFWLNFTANPNSVNPKNPIQPSPYNFNSDGHDAVEAERKRFIEAMTGKAS